MQAPRDVARRDLWAQSVARALTPPSLAPALAVERDLSDPGIWQESIWRSQRRREAFERQLNFGPLTAKRVAIPLTVLAAGVMARDAIVASDNGVGAFAPTASAGAAAQKRVAHRIEQVRPATVAGRKATVSRPPAGPAQVKKNQPTAASIAAARPAPPRNPMADGELTRGEHGAAVASMQQKLGVTADGIYGPSTLGAVKTFQKGQALVPDGRVGPATLAALAHPRPVAKQEPAKGASQRHHHS